MAATESDRRALNVDAAVAGTFFAAAALAIMIALNIGWRPVEVASEMVVVCLSSLALLFGRRFPLVTLVSIAVAVTWWDWSYAVPELRLLPLLFAGYRASSAGLRLTTCLPIVAVATIAAVPGALIAPFGPQNLQSYVDRLLHDPSRHILSALVVVASVFLATAAHRQRHTTDELRRQNRELVRLSGVDAARVAIQERNHIAREIHDIVAHHVSAMVIRAQAADRVADVRPEELRTAVKGIAEDGHDALVAMRRVVRVLRMPETIDGTPTPHFSESLNTAVERMRQTGLTVIQDIDSHLPLTDYESTALLRITQEALANVLLHSTAQRVWVDAHLRDDSVHIAVRNDGDGKESSMAGSGGMGILGMTERAHALGGSLTAGHINGGGWSVIATVPISARAPAL